MPDDIPQTYSRYAKQTDSPQFSEWLRASASEAWAEMLDHRFVSEMTSGDLDQTVFERYLLQEYAFVDTSATAVGYAVGKAPSMDERRRLADALSGLTGEQTAYFERTFHALGISQETWTDPPLHPETERFRDLVLRAATAGGYEEALAPMLAAEWLYATWCKEAAATVSPGSHRGEWIHLHTDEAFREHAAWLRDQLDEYGSSLPPYREQRIRDLFERTLRCEIAFHRALYEE